MGGASLAMLATGCQSGSADSLKIALLEGSIPPQLIQAFERQLGEGEGVSVMPADSLLKLFKLLQDWPPAQNGDAPLATSQPVAQWLTLGDYWLRPAIQQKLLQPVDVSSLEYWSDLPDAWGELLRRDGTGAPAKTGDLWGVPYRWGSLGLLYEASALLGDEPITQWADLLRPEWSRRLVLPDHPRLVIGHARIHVGGSQRSSGFVALW